MGMDDVDARLLRALEVDARVSISSLARGLGLSAPSVSERLKRLEEAGIIRRFTIEIEPAAVGYALAAYIRIRPMPGQLQKVASLLGEIAEITECDRVTGDDCFIAKACVRSVDDLERIIDRIIPFAQTNTSLVQSSPVARRLPALNGNHA